VALTFVIHVRGPINYSASATDETWDGLSVRGLVVFLTQEKSPNITKNVEKTRRGLMRTLIATLFFFCLLPVSSVSNAQIPQVPTIITRKIDIVDSNHLKCVAKAVYFEARGESNFGKFAVANVVVNRSKLDKYNDDPCRVVNDRCQFSWKCDGKSDIPKNDDDWANSNQVAKLVLAGMVQDNTKGATYFHSRKVNPYWRKKMEKTIAIGRHIFYREKE